jgi:hypothetical protein
MTNSIRYQVLTLLYKQIRHKIDNSISYKIWDKVYEQVLIKADNRISNPNSIQTGNRMRMLIYSQIFNMIK